MVGLNKWFCVLALLAVQTFSPPFTSTADAAKEKPAVGKGQKIALVEGFRSARFGMTEADVIKSIKKDFKLSGKDINRLIHPSEKTTALSVVVSNIVPGSGSARVAYILGFQTKRLIQVNIIWGNPVDPKPNPKGLVATANSLRDYFARRGFKKDDLVMNARLSDGSVLVFRGSDPKGRMVILLLSGIPNPEDAGKKQNPPVAKELSLRLSYISDPNSPDIFTIKDGAF